MTQHVHFKECTYDEFESLSFHEGWRPIRYYSKDQTPLDIEIGYIVYEEKNMIERYLWKLS